MGGKKYIDMFGSFTEPFSYKASTRNGHIVRMCMYDMWFACDVIESMMSLMSLSANIKNVSHDVIESVMSLSANIKNVSLLW